MSLIIAKTFKLHKKRINDKTKITNLMTLIMQRIIRLANNNNQYFVSKLAKTNLKRR